VSDWKDRASCREYETELFFSDSKSDQLFAQSICNGCPVRQPCKDSGDKNDFRDGVRAGYLPGTFKGAPSRAPLVFKKPVSSEAALERGRRAREKASKKDWSFKIGTKCPNGHVFTEISIDKVGRCKICDAERRTLAAIMGK